MAVSLEQFVENLTNSGLLSADELAAFQEGLPPEKLPKDALGLARELVQAKKLTKYQAGMVYQGKTKGLVLGEYTVLDRIGAGGMGQVLKAWHRTMDRIVALKVLSRKAMKSPDAVKRFHREVRAAGKLVHPNIVAAYDAGEHEGIHYLVMQYVDGMDLSHAAAERGPLPVEEAVDYIVQAAKGLEYAHSRGVVHRDVKPANLLLNRDGTVKVLDMGLARLLAAGDATTGAIEADSLTGSGQMMGTWDYMAPEQAEDTHHADHRADIYSLGCSLYRLLTGKKPYTGDTLVKVLLAHRDAPIPSLCDARPDVPRALDKVCQKMLAKAPQERYQSMTEVIQALEACVAAKVPVPPPVVEKSYTDSALTSFFQHLAEEAAAARQKPPPVAEETLKSHVEQETGKAIWKKLVPADRRRMWTYVGIGAAAAFLVVLFGVIIMLRTPAGTLVVEVNEPGATVTVDDGEVTLTVPDEKEPVRIKVDEGTHTLKVTKGGFETHTEKFTLESGGKKSVSVVLKRPKIATAPKPPPPQPAKPAVAQETPPAQPPEPAPQEPEKTATPEHSLAGILPRAAILPGMGRWQVDTLTPRGCPFPGNSAIDWSPDGKLIACATPAGNVRIYDAGTLRLVRLLVGHAGTVESVAWSPDGQRIATAGADNTVRLWNADGTPGPVLKGHSDWVDCVAWSPDGQRLASGSQDTSVRLWDADGTPGPVLREHTREVYSVAWSPDGKHLASGSGDRTIRLWKVDGAPGPILKGHTRHIWSVAWSPDGQRLASGSADDTVRLWDADGTPGRVLREHADEVFCVAWSPDGQRLATASFDMTVRLWNADGTPGSVLKGYTDAVRCVAWSPNGSRLASLDGDGAVRIWEADGTPGPVLERHTSPIFPLGWSRDGRRLASGGKGNSLQIWDSGGTLERVLRGHTAALRSVAWSPDGRRLASGGEDRTVRIWEADGTPGPVLEGHTDRILWVAWSPDARRLASCDFAKTVRLWRADGTPGPVLAQGLPICVAWSPDGESLASCGWDKTIRLWKVDATPGPVLNGHGDCVKCVAWSPDGQRLASASHDKTVRVWKIDGTPGPVLQGHGHPVYSVAWSPDGQRLASGSAHNTVRLWEADGTPGPVLEGHMGPVSSVAWSPDGLHVISAGSDSTIISWDANTAEPEWVMLLFNDGNSVKFTAAGDILHGDPETIEKELIYLVEKPSGQVEILKPSEFKERVAALPPPAVAPFDAEQAKQHQQAWADYLGVPVEQEVDLGDGVKLTMVLIPPGEFLMGSTEEEEARFQTESKRAHDQPGTERQHRVRINRPFRLSRHEVTRGQFRHFVEETGYKTEAERDGTGGFGYLDGEHVQDPRFVWNSDPGFPQTDEHPVVNVSWNDATAFCQWLSKKQGVKYALPTEAQWEYACRAGTTTAWHCGDSDTTLEEYAWCGAKRSLATHPVGQLKPNGWSLCDMYGNVWEWCADWFAADYYAQAPPNDPSGPPTGSDRVYRGGSNWYGFASYCRSAKRASRSPDNRRDNLGFRLASVLADE